MGSMAHTMSKLEAARSSFTPTYRKGHDHLERGASHKTYGIDVSYFDAFKFRYPYDADCTSWHGNQIVVYGDEALRDRILSALQPHPLVAPQQGGGEECSGNYTYDKDGAVIGGITRGYYD